MKTPPPSLFCLALASCLALTPAADSHAGSGKPDADASDPPASLEVHEWGTFTVLQGSDGNVIEWYQAPHRLVDLPPFVRRSILVAGKSGSGRLDTVRMETPVLYFYPEAEMDITVSASFPNGRITEVFPPAAKPIVNGETVWHGTLLAPDSPERRKVPAASGPRGRHYAAAREVPDAWLFRNQALPLPIDQPRDANTLTLLPAVTPRPQTDPPMHLIASLARPVDQEKARHPAAVEPIEHFIFYRGAGRHQMYELRAVQGEAPDEFTLSNFGKATIPKVFAIQVSAGRSSWTTLDSLAASEHVEGKNLNERSLSFPEASDTAGAVAAELRTAMIDSLQVEGLTSAEATAMVNTWDDLWFTEPGTRFLAILPQQFADEMVPLKITPTPAKIERVFVARIEIITREAEQILTSILSSELSAENIQPTAARLADLQLGRYSAGGMERALTLLNRQMRNRFDQLSHVVAEAEDNAGALQAQTN